MDYRKITGYTDQSIKSDTINVNLFYQTYNHTIVYSYLNYTLTNKIVEPLINRVKLWSKIRYIRMR